MSQDAGDAIAALASLVQALPPDADPFQYIKNYIHSMVFTPPKGYFQAQAYFFIIFHAVVTAASLAGCILRQRKGSFWLFQVRGGYILPNTTLTSQIMFLLYSAFYIMSIYLIELKEPTPVTYGVAIASNIPLGLAIHCQTWTTLFARPRSLTLLGSSLQSRGVFQTSPAFLRGSRPLVPNLIMIGTALLFVISIIIGRIFASIPRIAMRNALHQMDTALDELSAAGASLESLLVLVPVFTNFEAKAKETGKTEMTIMKVWLAWAVVWLAAYIPAAIVLLQALYKQKRHLERTLHNFDALSAIRSTVALPSVREDEESSTRRPSSEKDAVEFCVSMEHQTPSEPRYSTQFESFGTTTQQSKSVSHSISQNEPQKAEIRQKLAEVSRMIGVIVWQFGTTTVMIMSYGIFCTVILTPWFLNLPSAEANDISNTWRGFAFIGPGVFSSCFFLYASIRAPSVTPRSAVPAPPPDDDDEEHQEPIELSRANPLGQYTRTISFGSSSAPSSPCRDGRTSPWTTGATSVVATSSNPLQTPRGAGASWVPSKFVKERDQEAGPQV
ncbi:hypothetical protein T439DRAFT_165103 [Meredithblackwellia eburnea MCA 4105]